MAFRLGTNGQNAASNAFVQSVDAGTSNTTGRVLFYSGSQPSTPQTTATGTLLATLSLNNPSFGSATAGASALVTSPGVTTTVTTGGTVGYFRVTDRNNNAIWDGAVTGTGGGGEVTFDNTVWVTSGLVTLSSLTVTFGM